VTKKLNHKEEEYSKSADGLQSELNSFKHQLQVTHREKERAHKDKEALLEEVSFHGNKTDHFKLDQIV